jgi:signal transduction histidine kinase
VATRPACCGGLGLTVFRVVQESLTNTLKHAGYGVTARLTLRYLDNSVEIEISNHGSAFARCAGSGTDVEGGHGLVGMTERVAVFGGLIETGRQPDGGFRVFVALPTDYR